MATKRELAPRVLQSLGVLAVGESASSADQRLAEEKIEAVHAALKVEKLLRWTLNDVPFEAEEPYVLMAAALAAKDFGLPPDTAGWGLGMRQIQAYVALTDTTTVRAEYF